MLRIIRNALLLSVSVVLLGSCAATRDVDVTPTVRTSIDAHVGKRLSDDGNRVEDISDTFGPSETVFAVVDVPDRVDGTLRARWLRGDDQVHEQSMPILNAVRHYTFQLVPATGGHTTGSYRLEVFVGSDRVESENFQVQ